jgi:RNA polymerase-binding transcription factor DksA
MDAAPRAVTDPVRREIDATLRDAAQLVLIEIDGALRRIELGSYGRCRRCGDVMSRERLIVLPMATWCGTCHYKQDLASVESRRLHSEGRSAS